MPDPQTSGPLANRVAYMENTKHLDTARHDGVYMRVAEQEGRAQEALLAAGYRDVGGDWRPEIVRPAKPEVVRYSFAHLPEVAEHSYRTTMGRAADLHAAKSAPGATRAMTMFAAVPNSDVDTSDVGW
jgi:hypothetical protein